MPKRLAATGVAIVISLSLLPASAGASTADAVGSAHIGATYGFGSECSLQEGGRRLLGLGARVIKISLFDPATRYRFGACDWSGYTTASPPRSIAQSPAYRELFGMPFTTYVMLAFSSLGPDYWRQGVSDAQCAREAGEMYDLAAHLLIAYRGSRKQFVMQNWEGDWAVRGVTDPNVLPTPTAVNGMVRWFACRQYGLNLARESTPSDVAVLQGCEVNLVDRALNGQPGTVIDEVIPRTACDLVSYSAWDTVGYAHGGDLDAARARFRAALDHIAAKTPDPSPYVRAALCSYRENVYVGEFGSPENNVGTHAAMRVIAMAAEESLRWGARWALYWQLYDNELLNPVPGRPSDADVRGFWLIKPSGGRSAAGDYLASLLATPGPGPGDCPVTPAPPASGAPQDRRAPRLTRIRLKRRRLSLHVSEAATVKAVIARCGRRKRARCRVVARRSLQARGAGTVRSALRRPLRAGRYKVSARARDAAGNRSPKLQRRVRIRVRR